MLDKESRAADAEPEAKVPSWSLGEYLAEAGKALRTSLPRAWVDAVVLDAKATRGGISLELIEPFADERRNGRLRCLVWARAKAALEEELGLQVDAPTLIGTQVRLLIKTAFDARWHLEGAVERFDPRIIESVVAKRVEQIRATLRKENLYGAQRGLAAPADVTKVAVIHPDRAAGWADVCAELERLQAAGILTVASHPTPFEGTGAAGRLADLIGNVIEGGPDLILIVRGGGAAAGLAALANLSLARAVCRSPVPIIVGIGHATDHTIIDDCAWLSADTPSKALGSLKSILRSRCETAIEDHRTIVEAMRRLVGSTLQPLLTSSRKSLEDAADQMSAAQASALREMAYTVERKVVEFRGQIALTQADLDRIAVALLDAAPRVPRAAKADLRSLYSVVANTTRTRLPLRETLSTQIDQSAGIVQAFIDRQVAELRSRTSSLEAAMRRRLGDEGARLAATAATAQAMDVTAVLSRGFVLPLDARRHIIRSAEVARAADAIEFLFTDGSVACRPVNR